jgi:Rv0078B-related antitoxin
LLSSDNMNPERALQEQIERYRRMTGEQRLGIALDLHELSCNVAREGIRYQNPNADEAEVERRLRQRLRLARQ